MDMSNGLRLLAAWIDSQYPNDPDPQVQGDLMKWADEIDHLTQALKDIMILHHPDTEAHRIAKKALEVK